LVTHQSIQSTPHICSEQHWRESHGERNLTITITTIERQLPLECVCNRHVIENEHSVLVHFTAGTVAAAFDAHLCPSLLVHKML
jgi:hypothetical protein